MLTELIADGERRIDAGIVPKCIRRACRRISSATLGKKAHFCDRHHIASATAALALHPSVPHLRCSRSMVSSQTQPRQRGASLRSYVGDREHCGRHRYHPTTGWRGWWGIGGHGSGTEPAACTWACLATERRLEGTCLQKTRSAAGNHGA